MLYVISKDSELGNLVELYQNLDDAMQRRLMGYLEALWELSNGREIRLKKVQLQRHLLFENINTYKRIYLYNKEMKNYQ